MCILSSIPARLVAAALATAALGACAADVNPVRDAFRSAGIGPKQTSTPDFIARSRPKDLDYTPIGAAPPARPLAAKGSAEVKAAEAEMDRIRSRNEARGATARRAGAGLQPNANAGAAEP